MKRAIAIALAAGALCVVVAALLGRNELFERWYVYQISRDENRFDELLREGGETRRRALKRYLRNAEGKAFLARRCEEMLRAVPERMRGGTRQRQDWLEGSSFGSLAALPDTLIRIADGTMFVAYRGKDAMFDEGEKFLSLLDECLGEQFELPGAPGVTAAILPRRDALPRSGCYPRMISGVVEQMIVHSLPSAGPPADFKFTEEHRAALGDHPALFYSRE